MAVDKEMEAVFKSNRAGVDPVSGNDVPIGSTPEEVRDDIPAQLSEGEYVVPADVVRYFGVKFFEDLRTAAKTGWMQMEQNGRVGGEPVAPAGMEMGQDELPFDISELETIEAAEGTYVAGFDEGGLAGLDIAGTFAGMPNAMASGTEQRMYKNPNNPSAPAIPLIFINGQPSGQASFYIEQGYVPASGVTETPKPTAGEPTQDTGSSDDDEARIAKIDEAAKVNWNEATPDQFSKTLGMLESNFDNKLVTGVAGLALGPLGGIAASIGMGSNDRNMAYDMLDGIKSQLESGNLTKNQRTTLIDQRTRLEKIVSTGDDGNKDDGLLGKSKIFGGKSSMYEGLEDISGDGRVTFADTWLGDLIGADGEPGRQGPTLSESRAGARRGGDSDDSSSSGSQGTSDTSGSGSSDTSGSGSSGDSSPSPDPAPSPSVIVGTNRGGRGSENPNTATGQGLHDNDLVGDEDE